MSKKSPIEATLIEKKIDFQISQLNFDDLSFECECFFVEIINEFYLDMNPAADEQTSYYRLQLLQ